MTTKEGEASVSDASDQGQKPAEAAGAAAEEAGADLVRDSLDERLPPTPEPAAQKPFQPWHKPRKQFIRLRQWCDEVKALLAELTKARGAAPASLSYLTLPGDELLDVRVLHDVCGAQSVRLRYLGFNTPIQANE